MKDNTVDCFSGQEERRKKMILLPYDFCEDSTADKLVKRNVNQIIAKIAEYQIENACRLYSIPSWAEALDPAYSTAFGMYVKHLFPTWISPADAAQQYIATYCLVQSRRYYRLFLLQEYLLSQMIKEAIYLSDEILTEGDSTFSCVFSPRDREIVGAAMETEFIAAANAIYQAQRSKKGSKYLIYNFLPSPDAKIQQFESIYRLGTFCFMDDTFELLGHYSPYQLDGLLGKSEPEQILGSLTLPERWWQRAQDICDIEGNPTGESAWSTGNYLMYLDMADDFCE